MSKADDKRLAELAMKCANERAQLQIENQTLREQVDRLEQNKERYHMALLRIVEECGAVCEEFETCNHRSCNSSCGAVLIALEALRV